jgi:glutathione S-transferase
MALKLFIGPFRSCSLASHIALEEAGAHYETVRVDLSKNEQRGAQYAKINPKLRVPALATDQGVITENPAILFFIAQTHPQAKLAPLDPFALAKMQDFNSFLCSTVHPHHAHGFRGARWSDDPAVIEALKIKVPKNMADSFRLIENEYFAGPWLMGEQFTVSDCYLYTIATWLKDDGVDVRDFHKVNDHFKRMAERPTVQRVTRSYA